MANTIEALAIARLRATLPNARALPFLESLWLVSPSVTVTMELARGGVQSTLTSRFFRVKLPSPKLYLAGARLVRVRAVLDDPAVRLVDAADTMRYSSSPALHRHIRLMTGQHATAWRMNTSTLRTLDRWFETLITPYADTLAWFDPYAPTRELLLRTLTARDARAVA